MCITSEVRTSIIDPILSYFVGVIGDVGIITNMETHMDKVVVCGTAPQSIHSCLATLDTLLQVSDIIRQS